MKLTGMPVLGLAMLAHRAEDTDDDILLNEVMGEVENRDAADVWTSPTTGEKYPTGAVYEDFRKHYMAEMARRAAERRAKA